MFEQAKEAAAKARKTVGAFFAAVKSLGDVSVPVFTDGLECDLTEGVDPHWLKNGHRGNDATTLEMRG